MVYKIKNKHFNKVMDGKYRLKFLQQVTVDPKTLKIRIIYSRLVLLGAPFFYMFAVVYSILVLAPVEVYRSLKSMCFEYNSIYTSYENIEKLMEGRKWN